MYAAMVSLGFMALSSRTVAQVTLTAASVNVQAGQTAALPITINLGSASVEFFAVTFAVVPEGGAPAISEPINYQATTPPGPPQITSNAVAGLLAIGYVSGISPPLSGTVVVGILEVPIPAGAIGSYQVQLSEISAEDASGNRLTPLGQSGTIEVRGAPTPTGTIGGTIELSSTPTPTATRGVAGNSLSAGSVSSQAGQAAAVPITIALGSADVAFFGATFAVVPQGGAPAITAKLTYQAATPPGPPQLINNSVIGLLAIGYLNEISPPLTGTVLVGTLVVPIPAAATGSYQVQPSKISAGDSFGDKVAVAGQGGTITIQLAPTFTPTSTPTYTPTATPTLTPTPTPPCIGDCGGAHIVAVKDVITLVNIALGTAQPSACPNGVPAGATVDVSLIIEAVDNALNGCSARKVCGGIAGLPCGAREVCDLLDPTCGS